MQVNLNTHINKKKTNIQEIIKLKEKKITNRHD
jgi:hypothetical protein